MTVDDCMFIFCSVVHCSDFFLTAACWFWQCNRMLVWWLGISYFV